MFILPRVMLLPLIVAAVLAGCSSPLPNKDPTGQPFPRVTGTALSGEAVTLPDDLLGAPALLLVGYVQQAQFDLDRWLVGLLQVGTPVAVREVPTIAGLVPGMLSGTIDEGMRGGIPAEDWAAVVTVYDEAEALVELTGNTRPNNGRILLLDADGIVRWYHDRGFSARKLLELDTLARQLATAEG